MSPTDKSGAEGMPFCDSNEVRGFVGFTPREGGDDHRAARQHPGSRISREAVEVDRLQ